MARWVEKGKKGGNDVGNREYTAAVSSDWSECLSPNGPFDPISFNHPELKSQLDDIFRQYTGNEITLTDATGRISGLIPGGLTREEMDAYLDASFRFYRGVNSLIEWCLNRDILFMINTTGTQGYFQRVLARGLLPPAPVVASNPLIRFDDRDHGERFVPQVLEIDDKPRCTRAVMEKFGLLPDKLVLIGDSGGDGPHFQWGAEAGAFLIGSMTKHSLESLCRANKVTIDKRFGVSYGPGEPRDREKEMQFDFMELAEVIETALNL